MTTKDAIRTALTISHDWASLLAEDLATAPTHPPTPGGNHAHWVVGHLAFSEWGLRAMITGEANPRHRELEPLFSGGTQPHPDAAGYPPYRELLHHLAEGRRRTLECLDRLTDAELDRPPAQVPEELKSVPEFTTAGRLLVLVAVHQAAHFGQLADARRALGRSPLQM